MIQTYPIHLNPSNVNNRNRKELNVIVKELILTPLTCASVVNEIIKYLVYQKSQVPYTYNWLKSSINKRREETVDQNRPTENLAAKRHFKVVSTAFKALQELNHNLNEEFKTHAGNIRQILVIFGATIYNPKEVFSICLSDLAKGHSEDNHFHTNSKNLYKILRNIVLDEEWLIEMERAIPLTNMFVMLQKNVCTGYDEKNTFFMANPQYAPPSRCKHTAIKLHYNNSDNQYSCCGNLSIFEDSVNEKTDGSTSLQQTCESTDSSFKRVHDNSNCDLVWFQANFILQGFKECFINHVSATELW